MLTALSVARDCGIIEQEDNVVIAHALPPVGNQNASLEWMYTGDTNTKKTSLKVKTYVLNTTFYIFQ